MADEIQYMSQETFDELEAEFARRKREVRKEIAAALEFAKSLGDLSENFEYHDAKDRQAENEKRIMELDGILKNANIVEEQKGGSEIKIGTTFVADRDGKEHTYQIVGSNEANPMEGKVSNESPIGSAFLGAKVGDEVVIETPAGGVQYKVLTIK